MVWDGDEDLRMLGILLLVVITMCTCNVLWGLPTHGPGRCLVLFVGAGRHAFEHRQPRTDII